MKKTYTYFWVFVLALGALFSCEKNDPLSELGEVTSEKAPFITIAGIQALYPAGDSILYNAYYWTIADDIGKLTLLKGEQVTLVGNITVDDGAGPVTVTIDTLFETEMEQEGADLQHDDLDYETARNAYNKALVYEIPEQYQLVKIEDATTESFANIDEVVYATAIKAAILNVLKTNGVSASWDGLADITEEVDISVESTLSFQVRVYNKQGIYKDSPVRSVKVGVLGE